MGARRDCMHGIQTSQASCHSGKPNALPLSYFAIPFLPPKMLRNHKNRDSCSELDCKVSYENLAKYR